MPRRRNLNGIPHNIVQSFFGTERYHRCGYMGDWLLNAARKLNLEKASLNLLTSTFHPQELNIRPLILTAHSLKEIIEKELSANRFRTDFFVEAFIEFEFPDHKFNRTTIYCFAYLIDNEGRRYENGRMIGAGLEPKFDPFDEENISPISRQELPFWTKVRRMLT